MAVFILKRENAAGRALEFQIAGVFETQELASAFAAAMPKNIDGKLWYAIYKQELNQYLDTTPDKCVEKNYEFEDFYKLVVKSYAKTLHV